jgi:hypothetical protein
MPITLFLAAALLSSTSEPSTAGANVGTHLAQVRAFSRKNGDRLWPGYGTAPFGFLLIGDEREELICHDGVPEGFESARIDPDTGCRRFTRPRSGFPDTLLAAMPAFGPRAVIVMGTPKSTGRSEAGWARTILHEHFHQWQYALPSYFERTKALDLHDGDETGMWVLNFAFPYEEPSVVAAFEKASHALADAVTARRTARFDAAFGRYLTARKALAARAGTRNWRYLEFQLWQEGVARWTEIRLGMAYPRSDVRESAARLEEQTLKELASPDLRGKKREVVYAYGAAEAMLLEACDRGWRSEYLKVLSLGLLLESARVRCAS